MTEEEIIVNYYYIYRTKVTIEYIDKNTGEPIAPPEEIEGHEGDDYTSDPIEIPGYELVEEPENAEGEMTKDPIEVIYIYARPAEVIVSYIDKETNEELVESEVIKGHEGDEYKTEEKEIPYYNLVEKPENADGIMKVEEVDGVIDNKTYVTYYYQKSRRSRWSNRQQDICNILLSKKDI